MGNGCKCSEISRGVLVGSMVIVRRVMMVIKVTIIESMLLS